MEVDQSQRLDERQVQNADGGWSFKICDINRLKRYCVLGAETSTYRASDVMLNSIETLQSVENLIRQNRQQEVIHILKKFSLSGRVAKEDPILSVLAHCSTNESPAVRKMALDAVVEICNIPTKLFRFIEISQKLVDNKRTRIQPNQQPKEGIKKRKKREEMEAQLEALEVKDASEHSENNTEPPKKKLKKKKKSDEPFKPINVPGKKTTGWGRMRRKAIGKFYSDEKKNACQLLYLMTKYNQRHGWRHKDVLVYSHPKMTGKHKTAKDIAIRYCTKGYDKVKDDLERYMTTPGIQQTECLLGDYISQLEKVRNFSHEREGDEDQLLKILEKYGLRQEKTNLSDWAPEAAMDKDGLRSPIQIVREHIPTGFLNSKKVWAYLLVDMPMTALIRNLGKMSSLKLFDNEDNLKIAVDSMTNAAKLKKARVHPVKILIALEQYKKGRGDKGKLEWEVNQHILNALDEAYYKSFKDVELKDALKTNKKYMLGLDVSGSMFHGGCFGCEQLSPALAAFAMAWVTWHVEDDANVNIMAFGSRFEDLKQHETKRFRQDMKIYEVMNEAANMQFGATDCSLPMEYAIQQSKEVDAFIVYTDNDTQIGRRHPVVALRDYNTKMKRNAKLIVVGMTSNGFTIADPLDPNMLDVVGFDSDVPNLISMFVQDQLNEKCAAACTECR